MNIETKRTITLSADEVKLALVNYINYKTDHETPNLELEEVVGVELTQSEIIVSFKRTESITE